MVRRPPSSTRTSTPVPYATVFRSAAQQVARLGAHPLRVAQVAGVVVGHGHLERVPGRRRPQLDEELGDVAHLLGEGSRPLGVGGVVGERSEEHTSELQSLMRISYAVFCLQNKKTTNPLQYSH